MDKTNSWLFLVIALMWLLPLVSVETGTWGPWLSTIALAIIGIKGVMGK